jgi:transposase
VDESLLRRFAELEARIASQDARIAELEKENSVLRELLNRNSSNSSKPPSTDPPSTRAERREKRGKSGKTRGGQPGHKGSQRALVPPEQVDAFEDHFPHECENCWAPLSKTPDVSPQLYQTTELPRCRSSMSSSIACTR